MAAIMWTPDLSVGVKHIDDQHKLWFQKANELFEAGKQQRANEYIVSLFNFLDDYTRQHFRDEEAYMAKVNYPELDVHKKAHAGFIDNLNKLKSDFNQGGGNILVILNANKMIVDWLTNHIRVMDKKIGEYAKNHNK